PPAGERRDHRERAAGVVRASRTGRDDQMARVELERRAHRQRIVAVDEHLRLEDQERLHQVVGEGVVVVDQQHAGGHRPSSASSSARRRIALFASTSWCSLSGTLSATMPAPAWKLYSSPLQTKVRMVMA